MLIQLRLLNDTVLATVVDVLADRRDRKNDSLKTQIASHNLYLRRQHQVMRHCRLPKHMPRFLPDHIWNRLVMNRKLVGKNEYVMSKFISQFLLVPIGFWAYFVRICNDIEQLIWCDMTQNSFSNQTVVSALYNSKQEFGCVNLSYLVNLTTNYL